MACATTGFLVLMTAAWRHDLQLEHLQAAAVHVAAFAEHGFVSQRGGSEFMDVTGGGALLPALWTAARSLGVGLAGFVVVQAVLGVLALLAFALLLPRSHRGWGPAVVLLASFWIPLRYAVENSVFVGFAATLLFGAVVLARRRPGLGSGALLALGTWGTLQFSLTGALVLPAVVLGLWRDRSKREATSQLAWVGAVALLVLAPLALGVLDGLRVVGEDALTSSDDELGAPLQVAWLPLRLLVDPLLWSGVFLAARGRSDALPRDVQRLALLWLASAGVPLLGLTLVGQAQPYHFAGLAPAWAVLAALPVAWVLERVRRGRNGRAGAWAVGAWLLGCVALLLRPASPTPAEDVCWTLIGPDQPCPAASLRVRLDELRAVLPVDEAHSFVGSHASCMTGAWSWMGATEPGEPWLLLERTDVADPEGINAQVGGHLTPHLLVLPARPLRVEMEDLPGDPGELHYLEGVSFGAPANARRLPTLPTERLGGGCWDLGRAPSAGHVPAGWVLAGGGPAGDPRSAPQTWPHILQTPETVVAVP